MLLSLEQRSWQPNSVEMTVRPSHDRRQRAALHVRIATGSSPVPTNTAGAGLTERSRPGIGVRKPEAFEHPPWQSFETEQQSVLHQGL